MCGIDWSGARTLAEGLAEGGPWPVIARLMARFETGAVKGDAERRKHNNKENS